MRLMIVIFFIFFDRISFHLVSGKGSEQCGRGTT